MPASGFPSKPQTLFLYTPGCRHPNLNMALVPIGAPAFGHISKKHLGRAVARNGGRNRSFRQKTRRPAICTHLHQLLSVFCAKLRGAQLQLTRRLLNSNCKGQSCSLLCPIATKDLPASSMQKPCTQKPPKQGFSCLLAFAS